MNKKKIFIFEFVSGGGFNQVDIPSSLFCEGYGMLRSIIADFKSLDFEIFTLIDYRISFLSNYLQADKIKMVNFEDNYMNEYKESVKECEFSFIIAPEFSNILFNLTKIVKDNNKTLLSINLEGIKLGSSKFKTYEFFKNHGINTPKTYLIPIIKGKLDKDFIIQKFKKFKSPIVIKPDDGVGAESIYYLGDETQISELFHNYDDKFKENRNHILQEYIEGEDLSVSLIGYSNQKKPLILTVNSQDINIKSTESEYFGGHTPIENSGIVCEKITETLKKLDLSDFNGYFGIDFIRKKDKSIYFIEINPRLTTSYVGIRNILNYNPVRLILTNTEDLSTRSSLAHSTFSRMELVYKGNKSPTEIMDKIIPNLVSIIPELITPPISFNISDPIKKDRYTCFIATKENNFNSSIKRLTDIIVILKKFNFLF